MIKIAIANQSQHVIDKIIRNLLKKPACSVIWAANTCKDAMQKCNENPPDLLLLDITLPNLGGVELTRHIMEKHKCSILLTTTDIGQNAPMIFEAMGYGPWDVVSLKRYNFDEDETLLDNFIRKIDTIFLLLGAKEIIRKTGHKKG